MQEIFWITAKGLVEIPASTLLRCYKLQACEPIVIGLVCQWGGGVFFFCGVGFFRVWVFFNSNLSSLNECDFLNMRSVACAPLIKGYVL